MARERRIYLDCTKLVQGSRHGEKLIPRLRQYFGSRFRGTFNKKMSDKDLFAYTYARHVNRPMEEPGVRARASLHYASWLEGEPAPDYMCSWYRTALQDRSHAPFVDRPLPPGRCSKDREPIFAPA